MSTTEEVHETIKRCFREHVSRPHCYFGEPLTDEDAARHWTIRFDNDAITIGGTTLPLWSNVVACPEHDKLLDELYGTGSNY